MSCVPHATGLAEARKVSVAGSKLLPATAPASWYRYTVCTSAVVALPVKVGLTCWNFSVPRLPVCTVKLSTATFVAPGGALSGLRLVTSTVVRLVEVAAAMYVGLPSGVGLAPAVAVGSGVTGAPSARATSRRPKVAVPLTGSVVPTIWSWVRLALWPLATSRAARPATCADAAEVPLTAP